MKRKLMAYFSVFVILVFVAYMIWDTATFRDNRPSEVLISHAEEEDQPKDQWSLMATIPIDAGKLRSVAATLSGEIIVGGDSYAVCYDKDLNRKWHVETSAPITALADGGNVIYAAAGEIIIILSPDGRIIEEWGPYEANSLITSVFSGKDRIAFADAVNKRIFILDTNGGLISMIGQSGNHFVIPSPYFDVVLADDNTLVAANTGKHTLEIWNSSGTMISSFGTPGTAPGSFCGCCNPAHFTKYGKNLVTAEKGINRIKVIDMNGEFIEYVSSVNDFTASVPLDLAVSDQIIYAANPADSKLYVFERKERQ